MEVSLGALLHPKSGVHKHLDDYPTYAIDNGCYSKPHDCGGPAYLKWAAEVVDRYGPALFTTIPDVIGDAQATLQRAEGYYQEMQRLGLPLALVLQDGMRPEHIPWGEIAGVFVGGSTEFKLGPEADLLVQEARRRDMHTHMGRVNSLKRWRIAREKCYDTVDGTFLAYGPKVLYPKLLEWIAEAEPANPDCSRRG
jgi:hypothetical protein